MDITGDLYNAWDVSENGLLETAFKNLCNHYPAKIEELDSVIEKYTHSVENPADFAEYMNPPEFTIGKWKLKFLLRHILSEAFCKICISETKKKEGFKYAFRLFSE